MRSQTAAPVPASTIALVAALSGVAASIHLAVTPEHLAEWWGYGAFFALTAVGECALVVLLALRPRAWVLHAGIWGSLATALMYLVSRTSGIPLGPAAGVVEPVDWQGLAATAAEAATVVVLCRLLDGRTRLRTFNGLAVTGAALWVLALAGALAPRSQPVGGAHGGNARRAHFEQAARQLPFIPDSVRYGRRPPGDG
jgi:hypothetical protein